MAAQEDKRADAPLTKAELLERRAARAKADESRKEAAEVRVLELEDKFSEGGARRGHDFEIIEEGLEQPIVVKRGPGVIFSKWRSEPSSAQSTTDLIESCLAHPTKEEFHALALVFPPIRERTETAIASLYKAKIRGDVGKF